MDFVDIRLANDGKSFIDISFENGDIKTIQGFETALMMSIYGEKRAASSEIPSPQFRRGWWGNEALDFDDYEIGSKLWLLSQARETQNTLNNAKTYVLDSLQWMIDDGFLDSVEVKAQYGTDGSDRFMLISVDLIRFQNSVLSRGFKIWQNTSRIEVM